MAALHPGTCRLIVEAYDRVAPALGSCGLADEVGRRAAAVTFAGRARRPGGRPVLGGGDRATAEACAAVGRAAVLGRVARAVAEVLRRLALVDHRLEPSWPEGYLEARAAAQEAEDRASGPWNPIGGESALQVHPGGPVGPLSTPSVQDAEAPGDDHVERAEA